MSSSFKPSVSSRGPRPLQTFNVGSTEEDNYQGDPIFNVQPGERRMMTPEEAQDYQRRKQVAVQEQSKGDTIDSFSKKRLEVLAGIGRLTREVDIDGIVFTLRTLKARENKDAVTAVLASAKTEIEISMEFRHQTLARSIHLIDGQTIQMTLGDDSIESRLELFDEMDEAIVDRLNAEYQALVKDASGKYSFKTMESSNEVIEDLKK